MQILSSLSFQTKMQASCNCSNFVDKVSTGLCYQQNFGHDFIDLHNDDQKY